MRDLFPSSVQIVVERNGAPLRWGSGVVIGASPSTRGAECLVLTAGHTLIGLAADDQVFALLDRHQADSAKALGEVLAAQDGVRWDLALVKIRTGDCVAVRPGPAPSLGDAIWVVGFPHGGEMTVGRGIVSQTSPRDPGGPSRFTVDASTSHGSSGAGVFDVRTGRLIGLVEAFGTARVPIGGGSSSQHVDIPMPGMTYVTPVNRIDEFLREAGTGPLVVGRQ